MSLHIPTVLSPPTGCLFCIQTKNTKHGVQRQVAMINSDIRVLVFEREHGVNNGTSTTINPCKLLEPFGHQVDWNPRKTIVHASLAKPPRQADR
jgi:hypothetical protein